VIAQAAATAAVMFEGRFQFGVGSGEALNEHVLGDHWPEAEVRLQMLEEAVELIRRLWMGDVVSHYGTHYRVENARIYTRPDEPPPILVSGFGPRSVDLAARIGDGYCITMPDAGLIERFRSTGGGDKPVQAGLKVCFGPDEAEALRTVRRLWPNEALPGELAQVLPTPQHFEQATELVTEDLLAQAVPCGPDMERHLAAMQEFADAGVDELYIQQIGGPARSSSRPTRARCSSASRPPSTRAERGRRPSALPGPQRRNGGSPTLGSCRTSRERSSVRVHS
jgi:G6PDH family F420-dependent oxidoreductase